MFKSLKQATWKFIHAVFKVKVFEKILLTVVKGKYADSYIAAFVPPPPCYKNPAYRIAKKETLKLRANLHDYNDWKAYWGLKERERENLYALASKATTIIDIGTNNGWVLMNMAAEAAKNNGFVYGFEPHPGTYKRCIRNIELSKLDNCKVFNMGCGESESRLIMTEVSESNSGQNRIISHPNKSISEKKPATVVVTTLDIQLDSLDKVDLIKIDVEGFELHVLKGGHQVLSKHKPVIFMEINEPLLRLNNTSGEEVINFLKDRYQYTIKSALTKEVITETDVWKDRQFDIICSPS